jgi:hypothetical protein
MHAVVAHVGLKGIMHFCMLGSWACDTGCDREEVRKNVLGPLVFVLSTHLKNSACCMTGGVLPSIVIEVNCDRTCPLCL